MNLERGGLSHALSCPVQWGTTEEALARQCYGQEVNWWICVRGSEGEETDLEATAVFTQEKL